MAKQVEAMPEKEVKYPWNEWLDGGVWELTKGEDFEIAPENFRTAAYQAALSRGKRVTIRAVKGKLYMQASIVENADAS